ncbi:hypothetical protein SBA3_4220012 [Candidatus Sulfopaludibacter sp. SbA3]|nr:hypothetical protein SBA3_4220012 [Candidatus Sulfopaludibacter sp. SbA3]
MDCPRHFHWRVVVDLSPASVGCGESLCNACRDKLADTQNELLRLQARHKNTRGAFLAASFCMIVAAVFLPGQIRDCGWDNWT